MQHAKAPGGTRRGGVHAGGVAARAASTIGTELRRRGVEFPQPSEISDDEVREVLWCLIHCLAVLHVFVHSTDHLSDRRLYDRLYREVLKERLWLPSIDRPEAMHVDMVSGDNESYLRFYSERDGSIESLRHVHGMATHRREHPPFDRDRLLPRSDEMRIVFKH